MMVVQPLFDPRTKVVPSSVIILIRTLNSPQKTLSRDKERAELLRVHNSLDSIQAQLETEKQDFAKEVTRLTEENNDIRRAFRRLLQ